MTQRLLDFWYNRTNIDWSPESFVVRWEIIVDVVKNPRSDPLLALLLLLFVVLVLIALASVVALFLFSLLRDDDELTYSFVDKEGKEVDSTLIDMEEVRAVVEQKRTAENWYRLPRIPRLVLPLILLISTALLSAGLATQSGQVCITCHNAEATDHLTELKSSAHADIGCTSCHESTSLIERSTMDMPARLSHIITAVFSRNNVAGYRTFPRDTCEQCHMHDLSGVVLGAMSGNNLRMSHQRPLEEGMSCLQCHFFSTAQAATVEQQGMQVCIQCHDGTRASSECDTCHVNSPTVVGTTGPSPQNARALVAQSAARNACYRCHDPEPCDTCHGGFRMPHPQGFGGPPHAEIVQQRGVSACNPCHQATSPVSPPCLDCHDPSDF